MTTLRCIICGDEIPGERVKHRSVTCSREHAKELEDFRRSLLDLRRCRFCYKPSTPEERASYKQWARDTGRMQKQGRPVKPKTEQTTEVEYVDIPRADDPVS